MSQYSVHKGRHGIPRRIWILLASLIIVILIGIVVTRHIYTDQLKPVNASQKTQIFTVASGSTIKQISDQLETAHLIRSAWAMQLYIHSSDNADNLQAGTYAFSPSDSTPQIVTTMSKGTVTTRLVTILPGRRIDQVRADLINDGFSPDSVTAALNPAQYSDLAVLSYKPANVNSLEGLLWPDSFQKVANTNPSVIIRESLQEMGQHLTPEVQTEFASEGLSTYQGLILTSIVLQEVNKPTDQSQAAQVFLSRIKIGMMLGSDVTAYYGSIIAGQAPSLSYDSPYNTLIHTGLPPTPISTINASSLQAVTHPAATSWLYFVAGDDGTTYFSTNLQDQQANTAKYCHKLCSN
jgi:UPF0755 protein